MKNTMTKNERILIASYARDRVTCLGIRSEEQRKEAETTPGLTPEDRYARRVLSLTDEVHSLRAQIFALCAKIDPEGS